MKGQRPLLLARSAMLPAPLRAAWGVGVGRGWLRLRTGRVEPTGGGRSSSSGAPHRGAGSVGTPRPGAGRATQRSASSRRAHPTQPTHAHSASKPNRRPLLRTHHTHHTQRWPPSHSPPPLPRPSLPLAPPLAPLPPLSPRLCWWTASRRTASACNRSWPARWCPRATSPATPISDKWSDSTAMHATR